MKTKKALFIILPTLAVVAVVTIACMIFAKPAVAQVQVQPQDMRMSTMPEATTRPAPATDSINRQDMTNNGMTTNRTTDSRFDMNRSGTNNRNGLQNDFSRNKINDGSMRLDMQEGEYRIIADIRITRVGDTTNDTSNITTLPGTIGNTDTNSTFDNINRTDLNTNNANRNANNTTNNINRTNNNNTLNNVNRTTNNGITNNVNRTNNNNTNIASPITSPANPVAVR